MNTKSNFQTLVAHTYNMTGIKQPNIVPAVSSIEPNSSVPLPIMSKLFLEMIIPKFCNKYMAMEVLPKYCNTLDFENCTDNDITKSEPAIAMKILHTSLCML